MALLGMIPRFLNFCEYYPLIKALPNWFWPGMQACSSCCPPLPEASTTPSALLAPSYAISHGGCRSWPFSSCLPCWGVAEEPRTGQDCSSQLWPTSGTEKLRNTIQPGSRQQLIDERPPTLDFFQASKIALCLQSVCVCACMPGCVQISFPKAPCPYWVCFGGVPLHKYWKSPVELFYFIFELC